MVILRSNTTSASGVRCKQLGHILNWGGYGPAAYAIHRIISTHQWASTIAALSPEEDFVETFELSVLRKTGLQTLTLNTNIGSDDDVLSFLNTSSELSKPG